MNKEQKQLLAGHADEALRALAASRQAYYRHVMSVVAEGMFTGRPVLIHRVPRQGGEELKPRMTRINTDEDKI